MECQKLDTTGPEDMMPFEGSPARGMKVRSTVCEAKASVIGIRIEAPARAVTRG
jgi:hypothetical protein